MNDTTNLPAERISREQAASLRLGGGKIVQINSAAEARDFAMMMATADIALPKHLRGRPGVCLAVVIQAAQWNADPFQVANKSYVVNDRLAYEAQLYAALLLSSGLIKGRPRYTYEGEAGSTRRCTVTIVLADGSGTLEYVSPTVGKITPKNSPLWKTDEDQQLGYYSIRACGRRDFPDVLLGFLTTDEAAALPLDGVAPPAPVKPSTVEKLNALAGGSAREEAPAEDAEVIEEKPAPAAVTEDPKPARGRGRPKATEAKASAQGPTSQQAVAQEQVAAAVAQPLVQKTLETFPGSQVADVRAIEGAPEDDGANEIWGEFSEDEVPDPANVVDEFQGPVSDEEERIQTRMGELDHVPVGIDKDDLVQCTAYLDGYDSGVKGILEKLIPAHFATTDRKVEGVAWLLGFSASKPEEKRRTPPRAAAFVDGMIAALAGKPINSVPEALRPAERKSEFISWWQGHDAVTGDTPELRRARFNPQQK